MAYDNQGAAVGAAGHYASVITAACISAGIVTTLDDALTTFDDVLAVTFASCEALKGEQPEQAAPARKSGGFRRGSSGGNGGGSNDDPGTVIVKQGKHNGKTIATIAGEDHDYLDWMSENLNNEWLRGKVNDFLTAEAA